VVAADTLGGVRLPCGEECESVAVGTPPWTARAGDARESVGLTTAVRRDDEQRRDLLVLVGVRLVGRERDTFGVGRESYLADLRQIVVRVDWNRVEFRR
jgi:hypothetical protein